VLGFVNGQPVKRAAFEIIDESPYFYTFVVQFLNPAQGVNTSR
jgi:hypothetical protein